MTEKKSDRLNLARTKAAVDAFDLAEAAYQACIDAGPVVHERSGSRTSRATENEINEYNRKSQELLDAVDAAGAKVGEAFADDTADRNSRETATLLRPDAWLRRLVEQWVLEEAGMENDGDKIDKKVLDELVIARKASEAKRINACGVDVQVAYLLSEFSAADLRHVFESPLGVVVRESVALAAIDRLMSPSKQPSLYSVECLEELLVRFEQLPEIHDQLHVLIKMLSVIDKLTVECKVCHKPVPARTAHRHQGEFVGDACCWDERLRTTE